MSGEVAAALAVTLTAVPATVAPPAGAVSDPVGGARLFTVTLTPAEVVLLPAVSTARAVMVWLLLVTPVEFQDRVYGAALSVPTTVPSRRKSTWSTAPSSAAAAESVTAVPATLAPGPGLDTDTAGGSAWLPSV